MDEQKQAPRPAGPRWDFMEERARNPLAAGHVREAHRLLDLLLAELALCKVRDPLTYTGILSCIWYHFASGILSEIRTTLFDPPGSGRSPFRGGEGEGGSQR